MSHGGHWKDEDDDPSPFGDLQKNVIMRDINIFNERNLHVGRCSRLLTKILYLLTQGEEFTPEEVTTIFFSVTKLFQSKDVHLRRLTYLVVKELNVSSDESLIVVNCLNRDMTSKIDLYRANAIRVLAKIMDPTMVVQIERFLKQAIVDSNPFIVASTLLSGQHLYKTCPDVIRRWSNEVQEALNSSNHMVQFQALSVTYLTKQKQPEALRRIVQHNGRGGSRGALAYVLQIRIAAKLIAQRGPKSEVHLVKFLVDCLHSKNFQVKYEAARQLCSLPGLGPNHIEPAVAILQEFLSSPVPAQRFAAVRTLAGVVDRFPGIVGPCSVDLDRLLFDSNKSIATLAVTTLLKTCAENTVDRLVQRISEFMSEVGDEFRIVLVGAIRQLTLRFPDKHIVLVRTLAEALRDEGGREFKSTVVDALLTIAGSIPSSKELVLEHLCEFIEDCEFPELSVRVLSVLGVLGPKSLEPAKYLRFIFNRVILETSSVRSAAVDAIGKFGACVPELRENAIVLLRRSLNDNDDDVRERALLNLKVLQWDKDLVAEEVLLGEGEEEEEEENKAASSGAIPDTEKAQRITPENFLFSELPISVRQLEASVAAYLAEPEKAERAAFSLATDLVETLPDPEELGPGEEESPSSGPLGASTLTNPYLELLRNFPQVAEKGEPWQSSEPVQLTEPEMEYVVSCVKHLYPEHIVFQFMILNNMEDQELFDVHVQLEPLEEDPEDAWNEEFSIGEARIPPQSEGMALVCYTRPRDTVLPTHVFDSTLRFVARDFDPNAEPEEIEDFTKIAGGMEDQYNLEELEVREADFMSPLVQGIGLVEFRRQWEALGNAGEAVKKYRLGLPSLQQAVTAILSVLGLAACEQGDLVPEDARSHALNMVGTCLTGPGGQGVRVFARAGFVQLETGVALKLAVRSASPEINAALATAIR